MVFAPAKRGQPEHPSGGDVDQRRDPSSPAPGPSTGAYELLENIQGGGSKEPFRLHCGSADQPMVEGGQGKSATFVGLE